MKKWKIMDSHYPDCLHCPFLTILNNTFNGKYTGEENNKSETRKSFKAPLK